MKFEKEYTIGLFDVDYCKTLTIQAVGRLFQEMATLHSASIGAGYQQLNKRGVVWFLHRLEIEPLHLPKLFDKVTAKTWSMGFKGFKGFREYRICTQLGDVLVKGSSIWLFYDVNRQRVSKVPKDISDLYQTDPACNFSPHPDQWRPLTNFEPDETVGFPLRYSDFDINGHVNNTIYLGFLESFFHRTAASNGKKIQRLKIQYSRQIDQDCDKVTVGCLRQKDRWVLKIYNDNNIFSQAEIQ